MKNNEEETVRTNTHISWYPGHMAKTRREILENIKLVDIIYELVDARIPFSSKISDIDTLIKDKPKILIMTKYDLCDKSITNKWAKHYEDLGYKVILMDLINNYSSNKLIELTKIQLKEMDEIRFRKGLKQRPYRALILGVPNVGKSTLINRFVGKRAVKVGDRPGVTKQLSWIRIDKNIELLDSPGILWPKIGSKEVGLNLASFSAIKEEMLPIDEVAVYILDKMSKLYSNDLFKRYGITDFDINNITESYDIIGKKRGCLIRGGEVDYEKVSYVILRDLREGYLGGVTFDE